MKKNLRMSKKCCIFTISKTKEKSLIIYNYVKPQKYKKNECKKKRIYEKMYESI